MKQLIRKILKEESESNELLKVVNKEGIFSVAKLVGGIDNLKSLFKDNPAVLERIGGANGIVKVSYSSIKCPCIELKFDIIGEQFNKWGTNSWGAINVKYDESKLTEEEINLFNTFIIQSFDMEGSFKIINIDCPELKKTQSHHHLTLKEINGVTKEFVSYDGRIDRNKVQKIIDKLSN